MFPIDQSAIPSLPVRKALVIIDFQNDFLDAGGVLQVTEPEGLVSRTLELAKAFRKVGEVVWVCTEFDKNRPLDSESILLSDAVKLPSSSSSYSRRRTNRPEPPPPESDPEAYLSPDGSACVRTAPGINIPSKITETFGPRDITFIKSHYSAFKSGQLLQLLRGKLITQLFFCGSLTNIGVHATAIDAAMYGNGITIVEDCCGYRSPMRQTNAVRDLVEQTGCDVLTASALMEKIQTKPSKPPAPPATVPAKKPPTQAGSSKPPQPNGDSESKSSDLTEKLAALKLNKPSAATKARADSPVDSSDNGLSLEVDPEAQPTPTIVPDDSAGDASVNKDKSTESDSKSKDHLPAESGEDQSNSVIAPVITKVPEGDVTSKEKNKPVQKEDTPKATEGLPISSQTGKDAAKTTSEPLCEGDTSVVYEVLPAPLAETSFASLEDEVQWQRMSHQGGEVPRLVAVQGAVEKDGSMPVYRHPADESPPLLPFSPTVTKIKNEVEKHLGHSLNHVLIQYYRDGTDYISEHSDKTLDIVKDSHIANVSLGAERTMTFRTKRQAKDSATKQESGSEGPKRKVERAPLPDNSLCRVGLQTNMRWLHAIRQDKRLDKEKTPAELAFSGGRISLTFRSIGTFLNREGTLIWGQGASSKTKEGAQSVVNGQSDEAVRMLRAFGTENQSSVFDWEQHYGPGFNVLHISNSPRLFYSSDAVVNMRIKLMLAYYGITYAKGSMSPSFRLKDDESTGEKIFMAPTNLPIKFVDNDKERSIVQGDIAIMLYLDAVYGNDAAGASARSQAETARLFTRFQQALGLLETYRRAGSETTEDGAPSRLSKNFLKELALWEGYANEAEQIAGPTFSLADFAFWPVLQLIVKDNDIETLSAFPSLQKYYGGLLETETFAKVEGLLEEKPVESS